MKRRTAREENSGDEDDDDIDEFAFDLDAMPRLTNMSSDQSMEDDTFRSPSKDSVWELQDSSHHGIDDPFGTVQQPPTRSLFRSLSSLMVRGGGGKTSKLSSASVGLELESRATKGSNVAVTGGSSQRMMPIVRQDDQRRSMLQKIRLQEKASPTQEDEDSPPEKGMRPSPTRAGSFIFRSSRPKDSNKGSLKLPGGDQPDVVSRKSSRRNSSSSLPDAPSIITRQESFRLERNCIVLDIRRKPTGETDENTDGYRVVHLVTEMVKMSVWDAVREAHRSYPENRLFKVDSSLERALQNGTKRGILVVSGPSEEDGALMEIKQSFDYWKNKDFQTTVDALVPSNKQFLSIQVEYANVLQAVEGERDIFDKF